MPVITVAEEEHDPDLERRRSELIVERQWEIALSFSGSGLRGAKIMSVGRPFKSEIRGPDLA